MIDLWTLRYDPLYGVWKMKSITDNGVTYTYIKDGNTIILRHDSEIAKLWVKTPQKLIKELFNANIERVKYAFIDVVNKYARITAEANGTEYIVYCNRDECFEIPGGEEEYFIPCRSTDGYRMLPDLNYTYVKPGDGYLIVKRCFKTPAGLKTAIALWRPGTYITRIFSEGETPEEPAWEWVAYNGRKWYIDDEGIHVEGSPKYRLDDIETSFVLDGPAFSVQHSIDGTDYIVTSKVVQKIYTGASTPRELFWKIFTGLYTFV